MKNQLEQAFDLYKQTPPGSLVGDAGDDFVSLVHRYVCHCVHQTVRGRSEEIDDIVAVCTAKVWQVAQKHTFPDDSVSRFVEGMRITIRNRCYDVLRGIQSYESTIRGMYPKHKRRLDPCASLVAQEAAENTTELLVSAMCERARFPVVTPELCASVVGWMNGGEPVLKTGLKNMGIAQLNWYTGYMAVLYRWARYDLAMDMQELVDRHGT